MSWELGRHEFAKTSRDLTFFGFLDAAGIYRGETFPGLWLDSAAMLRGDLAAVLTLLQQSLPTPSTPPLLPDFS
jgi:hypothetical protein